MKFTPPRFPHQIPGIIIPHLLPTRLAKLADATNHKGGANRWAVVGVHVRLKPDGSYVACATDTRSLVRVTGPGVGPVEDYPEVPALAAAPNGHAEAIVPAAAWKSAFAAAEKLTRRSVKPILRSVAVVAGENVVTMGCTDLDTYPVEQARRVEGRYPPVDDIVPKRPRPGAVTVGIDPLRFADTLRTLAAVAGAEPGGGGVTLEVAPGNKPIVLRATAPDGAAVDGLVMPFGGGGGDKNDEAEDGPADESALVVSLRARVAELERAVLPLEGENTRLAGERNRLAEQFAELSRTLDAVQANARGLAEDRDRLQVENARLARLSSERFRDACTMAAAVESANLAADRGGPARPPARRERLAAKGVTA